MSPCCLNPPHAAPGGCHPAKLAARGFGLGQIQRPRGAIPRVAIVSITGVALARRWAHVEIGFLADTSRGHLPSQAHHANALLQPVCAVEAAYTMQATVRSHAGKRLAQPHDPALCYGPKMTITDSRSTTGCRHISSCRARNAR